MPSIRRPAVLVVAIAALALGGVGAYAAGPVATPDDHVIKNGKDTGPPNINTSPEPSIAEGLEILAGNLQTTRESGYADVAIDIENRRVDLWWKGDVAPKARKIIGASTDFAVTVHKAVYDRTQLDSAANKIEGFESSDGSYRVLSVTRGSLERPTPEFGLIASIKAQPSTSDKEVASELTKIAGLPVSVDHGGVVNLSRQDDSNPWYGGGQMIHQATGTLCSTGFGVRLSSGSTRLLSAGHCDPQASRTWTDGVGDKISDPPNNYRYGLDSLLVDPIDTVDGRVFGAAWNATTSAPRYSLAVKSKSGNQMGSTLCVSGARSGEKCGLKITSTDAGDCGDPNVCRRWGARKDFLYSVTGGDSGGPVYADRQDGGVTARGIVQGADPTTRVACGSRAYPNSDESNDPCYYKLIFNDITSVLNTWNATIVTD